MFSRVGGLVGDLSDDGGLLLFDLAPLRAARAPMTGADTAAALLLSYQSIMGSGNTLLSPELFELIVTLLASGKTTIDAARVRIDLASSYWYARVRVTDMTNTTYAARTAANLKECMNKKQLIAGSQPE